jgi:hypothetical protein
MLIVLKSGNINLLEPYGIVKACNGIGKKTGHEGTEGE